MRKRRKKRKRLQSNFQEKRNHLKTRLNKMSLPIIKVFQMLMLFCYIAKLDCDINSQLDNNNEGENVSANSKHLIVIGSKWQSQVFLPCKFERLDEDQTVSWIRLKDSLVLTVDRTKLIDESRIGLLPNTASRLNATWTRDQIKQQQQQQNQDHDWTLRISEPSDSDSGLYECQVSSMEPKMRKLVELRIVDTKTRIKQVGVLSEAIKANQSSVLVRIGERVHLTCSIEAPQQTDFVYWYRNKEPIQYDQLRLEPSLNLGSSSSLLIRSAQLNDTGNYTCMPSNAQPATLTIIVVPDGFQSQPEKRSLSSSNGAGYSVQKPLNLSLTWLGIYAIMSSLYIQALSR